MRICGAKYDTWGPKTARGCPSTEWAASTTSALLWPMLPRAAGRAATAFSKGDTTELTGLGAPAQSGSSAPGAPMAASAARASSGRAVVEGSMVVAPDVGVSYGKDRSRIVVGAWGSFCWRRSARIALAAAASGITLRRCW